MATQIINAYASRANHAINDFYNIKLKIALLNKDLWFNNQCLTNEVIPNYVNIKPNYTSKAARIASDLGRKTWVKNEIKNIHAKKQTLYEKLYKLHLEIANEEMESKHEHNKEKYEHILRQKMYDKQITLNIKLDKLINRKNKQFETNNNNNNRTGNKHIFYERTKNLTNVILNANENRLLNKGLKHNIDDSYDNKENVKQTIVDCERALKLIDPAERNHARHLIVEKINKAKFSQTKINKAEKQSLVMLKKKLKDNEIMALKADKGNTTVLMYKQDYVNKTMNFIADNDIQEINKDPTINYQNNIKSAIKNINFIMSINDKKKVINMNPKAPNLRAMPKIHKNNTPMRPIINYRKAPGYKLAVFLQRFLKEHITLLNNRSLKNSQDLIDKIKHNKWDKNTKMTSLDAINMYTNVPIGDTIIMVEQLLLTNGLSNNETNEVIILLKLILNQNYFSFNNKIFIQKEGLGMGNPLSGLLADIYLNNLENKMIKEIQKKDNNFQWHRYVDDIWSGYNSNLISSENILNICNELSPILKFTKEDETNSTINYLDVTIIRKDDNIETKVYRKPTTTAHAIHISSNHPENHKQAAFRCYLNRVKNIPNTDENKKQELHIINQIALDNGYNINWVNKIKSNMEKNTNKIREQDKIYAKFTYINKHTNKITQIFRNKYNMKIAYNTNNNLRNHIGKHNLTEVDPYKCSGVYQLICTNNNCNRFYYGQTGRNFNIRFLEHKNSVKYNRSTAFGAHAFNENHSFGPIEDNLKIIKIMNKGTDLNTREAIEIYLGRKNENSLNEQETYGSNAMFSALDQHNT